MPRRYQFLDADGHAVDLGQVEAAIAELTREPIAPERYIRTYLTLVEVAFFHLIWACGKYPGQPCSWIIDSEVLDEYCEAIGGPPIRCPTPEESQEWWGKLRPFIDGTRYRFKGWG
ncbi:MAG TPA: hypothetical protein VF541_06780 [Longimicrobium sp.]|jgi:hypothetical protein